MKSLMNWRLLIVLCSLAWVSCSTPPPPIRKGISARELYSYACELGKGIRSVEGTVRMKATSPEFSGQFSANVSAKDPDELKLEVTNPFGGTEALVQVDRYHYEISGTGKDKNEKEIGFRSWGGLPLRWAAPLFLGKVPCPPIQSGTTLATNAEGDLLIHVADTHLTEAQEYLFHFKSRNGQPWPESLHWEKPGEKVGHPSQSIDFKFDDPEEITLSPLKWEVTGQKSSVRVKWRSREKESNLK